MKTDTHKRIVKAYLSREIGYKTRHNPRMYSWEDRGIAKHTLANLKRRFTILEQWEALEDAGLVRIERKPDECASMDDMKGDSFDESNADTIPGGLRTLKAEEKEFDRKLEQDGAWGIVGEYRIDDGRWIHADSCWGFDYDYAFSDDNDYLTDCMAVTIDALRKALKARCPLCRKPK